MLLKTKCSPFNKCADNMLAAVSMIYCIALFSINFLCKAILTALSNRPSFLSLSVKQKCSHYDSNLLKKYCANAMKSQLKAMWFLYFYDYLKLILEFQTIIKHSNIQTYKHLDYLNNFPMMKSHIYWYDKQKALKIVFRRSS